jgi:uncharacterized membrane protein
MGFSGFFYGKNRVSRVIFVLIVLYALIAVLCFWATAGAAMSDIDRGYSMIGFSMLSFVLTIVISAYHLSTLIKRRKRVMDKIET